MYTCNKTAGARRGSLLALAAPVVAAAAAAAALVVVRAVDDVQRLVPVGAHELGRRHAQLEVDLAAAWRWREWEGSGSSRVFWAEGSQGQDRAAARQAAVI